MVEEGLKGFRHHLVLPPLLPSLLDLPLESGDLVDAPFFTSFLVKGRRRREPVDLDADE